MSSSLKVDLLVVGGGIMGLALTEAYSRSCKVLCLRLSDAPVPRAETLRNQGWLQSGARYYWAAEDDDNRNAAIGMVYAARDIRKGFPQQVSESTGIRYLPVGPSVNDAMQRGELPDGQVVLELALKPVSPDDARKLAGSLADGASTTPVKTAERAFDEGALLQSLRARAIAQDAQLRVVEEPVRLEWEQDQKRVVAQVDGYRVEAGRVFAAAGVGAVALAKQLSLQLPITVRRTPLLVVQRQDAGSASVLQDSARQFSVCWHPVTRGECGVVGCVPPGLTEHEDSFDGFDHDDYREARRRAVPAETVERIRAHLPQALSSPDSLVRGGFEVVPSHLPDWRFWFHEPDCSNLVFAFPGRATFALRAASEALDRDREGEWKFLSRLEARASFFGMNFPGKAWDERIAMHYEDEYSSLHEVRV